MEDDKDKMEYRFQHLPSKHFESLDNKEILDSLLKWSMKDRIQIQAFSFDKPFQRCQKQSFIEAFFADPNVTSNLLTLSPNGKWTPLSTTIHPSGTTSSSVKLTEVSCSITSMAFFDRLYGEGVVREGGSIVRCEEEFSEVIDSYLDDELRKMLLSEDSENWALYSEEERGEFLLMLFVHVLVGGSLCQADDAVQGYLSVTKALYRDLIGVHKDSKSNKILVSSVIFKVSVLDDKGDQMYPCNENHYQNFSYLCVDPLKKQVLVLCHRFGVSLPDVY